ncbi:MAG TPA: DinB family protein [Edaphobacter sp.]
MELNPYSRFLGGQEPIPVITATVERLHDLIDPLSPALADREPAPGKWCIREIVAHLADCEIVFAVRLRQTLAEEHHFVQPFDQTVWGERYGAYDLASALATFAAVRSWNLKFLTTVTAVDRHHPVTHPERGTMTLWTIVETMAGHDINHLQHLERIVGKLSAAE